MPLPDISLCGESGFDDEMSWGRLIHAYFTEARYECVRMLRAPSFAVPFLLLPPLLYLFFGVMLNSQSGSVTPSFGGYLFIGFCTMAVMGPALFGMGCSLATERTNGALQLKRALPAPPGSYVLAKMIMSFLFASLALLAMIAVGLLSKRIVLGPGPIVALSATLLVGHVVFCAMGLYVGAHTSGNAAPAFMNLLYLPMIYLSGIFIPLPASLRQWAIVWPAFHLDQLALRAAGIAGFTQTTPEKSAAFLLVLTIVLGALTTRKLARSG